MSGLFTGGSSVGGLLDGVCTIKIVDHLLGGDSSSEIKELATCVKSLAESVQTISNDVKQVSADIKKVDKRVDDAWKEINAIKAKLPK